MTLYIHFLLVVCVRAVIDMVEQKIIKTAGIQPGKKRIKVCYRERIVVECYDDPSVSRL